MRTNPNRRRKWARGGWTPPGTPWAWWYGNATEDDGKWTDRSGNGRHATFFGSPSLSINGLTLDGSAYAYLAAGPVTLTGFTMACWVRLTAAGGLQGIMGNWIGGQSDYALIAINSTLLAAYNNTQSNTLIAFTSGVWVHIAVRWTGDVVIGYVNTTPNTPVSLETAAENPPKFGIGWAYWVLTGDITDAIVYDTDIGADGIANIYAQSTGKPT